MAPLKPRQELWEVRGAGLPDSVPLEAWERIRQVHVDYCGALFAAEEDPFCGEPERHHSVEASGNAWSELAVVQEQLTGSFASVGSHAFGHHPA